MKALTRSDNGVKRERDPRAREVKRKSVWGRDGGTVRSRSCADSRGHLIAGVNNYFMDQSFHLLNNRPIKIRADFIIIIN